MLEASLQTMENRRENSKWRCELLTVKDPYVDRILGKYRLLEGIGGGTYGEVYRAEHIHLGAECAIKILHASFAHQENALKRFGREAKTTSRLKHPHIVSVTDFDIDPKMGPYLVMEYLEGETLGSRLYREGALSLLQIRDIAKPICLALSAAHQLGVIHRDLKPDNIFLAQMGRFETVKILDFGIARLTQGGEESLTGIGQTLGTPEYMSPEQCRGLALTAQSDIYCFGILLYQMLTGSLPFEGTHPHELMVHHLTTPPPALSAHYPLELQKLLFLLLEKHPEKRPTSLEEVWSHLSPILPRKDAQPSIPHTIPSELELPSLDKQMPSAEHVILLVHKKTPVPATVLPDLLPLPDSSEEESTYIDLDAIEQGEETSEDVLQQRKLDTTPEPKLDEVSILEQTFEDDSEDAQLIEHLLRNEEPERTMCGEHEDYVPVVQQAPFLNIDIQDEYEFEEHFLECIDNGGMFLPFSHPFPENEVFFFRFSLPDGSALISGWGEVRRSILPDFEPHRVPGMFVRFTQFEPESRKRIERMLDISTSRH